MSETYRIDIKSTSGSYFVTDNLKELTLLNPKSTIILYDDNLKWYLQDYLPNFSKTIALIANEENKTFQMCSNILSKLAAMQANRSTTILTIGGGVLQDITTLVASLYMRGIKWVFVPTTLMAMLDSCIGGKSSINLGNFKNLVGNFYPPVKIIININFLETLNSVSISSGIAEGLKITYARGSEEFKNFTKSVNEWRITGDNKLIMEAILLSLKSKAWFIEVDEFDRAERRLLNFGHTFGHALEASTKFTIPHGIGVLLGMYSATNFAGKMESNFELIKFIKSEIKESTFNLSDKIMINKAKFFSSLKIDKKNSYRKQVLILPSSDSKLTEQFFPLTEETHQKCLQAVKVTLKDLDIDYEVF